MKRTEEELRSFSNLFVPSSVTRKMGDIPAFWKVAITCCAEETAPTLYIAAERPSYLGKPAAMTSAAVFMISPSL
jgi:hypothetical protein